ncbi:MAG: hypothetical protein ACJZ4Z_01670 [Candidatus Thalassarchaeaceae archaeon]
MKIEKNNNFYSNVDWLFWSNFDLKNLPKDFDELVDFVAMHDRSVLVKLEEEYEHSRQWKRRMKSFSRVILSLIAQNEFRGRQKK